VNQLKVKIEDGCIGCGMCESNCPNVFRMTDDGIAEVFAMPEPADEGDAQEAANNCPVSVINVSDD